MTSRLLMGLLLMFPFVGSFGQQFSITAGTITTCSGVLEDSGGPSGQYANNENFTVVICADNPGDGISLNWLVSNLSGTQPNPDVLRIWDGDNTGATSLGQYTGTALQGLIVSATTFNTTGCLTVQFVSNGAGVGDFAASITCFTPCERPIAVASMTEAAPALICVGEVVDFDGMASYAAAGFNIVSYTWDFDDGATAAGPTSSHSFAVAGEYIVQLNLIDDNDCVNANVVDLQILVSTTPTFAGTLTAVETCIGATIDLSAVANPVTWTGLPDANFGDGIFLPDDVGQPFTSSLSFTQFDPGQTVTSTTNILSICVSMEHTFMGDLVLQVICPNGSSMIFHQQGGGGTYIGSPNDTDSNANPIIGECWNYCWSPTATNGTWVANSNAGSQNTTLAGIPPAQSLNPGTYEPVQPFSNLVGCPLNGEWTYQSTDLWGADNGFICSWSINFDPTIIPDVTQFTPDLGTVTMDSSLWTGPNITLDPVNPLLATAYSAAAGSFDYTFFVTDNFGCTYDTTVTVVVPPAVQIEAGPDIVLCSAAVPMAGTILANPPSAGNVTYSWSPVTGLVDPSNPVTNVYVTEPTMFYLSAYLTGHPECAVTDSVLVSPDPSLDPGQSRVITLCASDPIITMIDSLGGTPDAGGVWTNGSGAPVGGTFEPATGSADTFTYTVTSPGGCVATATLQILMLTIDDPLCCGVPDAGPPMVSCDLTIALNAIPGNTGVGQWSGPAGAMFGDIFAPVTTVTMPAGSGGTHMFYWSENDNAFCNTIDSVQMTFTDAYVFTPTLTNALCFGYCDGEAVIAVTGGNTVVELTYEWSNGVTGIGTDTISDLCAGDYMLRVRDDNNCTDSLTVTITEPILLEIDSLAMQPVTCSGDCDGQLEIYDLEAVEYSYNDGASWSTNPTTPDVCEGVHLLQIRDAIGCIGTGNINVTGPPPVIAEFAWGPIPANVNAPTITFGNQSANAIRYFWNVADLFSTTDANTEYTFSNKFPGVYEVCLVAYNFNDCADTICHNIIIDDVLVTYVPNSFTPDGDGHNEFWGMSMNIPAITEFEMLVFDRWGQVVYSTTDPYKPWLGSFQNAGNILKSDVYAYRILYTVRQTQARKELIGHVTLLK